MHGTLFLPRRRFIPSSGIVSIALDSSIAVSTAASTTHNFTSKVSAGPVSVIFIAKQGTAGASLSSVTWNGNSCSILEQDRLAGNQGNLAAIAIISAAQSGTIAVTFASSVGTCSIITASLVGLNSITAIDTDKGNTGSTPITLSALNSPGVGGIRLVCINNRNTTAITSLTNGSLLNGGAANSLYYMAAGYDLGNDGSSISYTGGTTGNDGAMVGASLR